MMAIKSMGFPLRVVVLQVVSGLVLLQAAELQRVQGGAIPAVPGVGSGTQAVLGGLMHDWLVTAIIPRAMLQTPVARVSSRSQVPQPIFVVADGTLGWERQQADRILDALNQVLSSRHPLLVAWFDAEPVMPHGFAVRGTNRDVIVVRPRTAMGDVMEIGFAMLAETAKPRAMIVVAQQQFYPNAVPSSRLLESARHSGTRIYTIHLPSKCDPANRLHHIGRSVGNGFCSIVERLILRQRAYSARATARFLKLLSDQTGGSACVAEDEQAAVSCAAAIGNLIEGPGGQQ